MFNFDTYGLGTFSIDVGATDADSDRANESLCDTKNQSVTVSDDDTTGPIITPGGSQNSETDGQTQSFNWSVSDPSGISALSVVITRDDGTGPATIFSSNDPNVLSDNYNFDTWGLGTYTLTINATDAD